MGTLRASTVDPDTSVSAGTPGIGIACPDCGALLRHAEGCVRCAECGHSRCD